MPQTDLKAQKSAFVRKEEVNRMRVVERRKKRIGKVVQALSWLSRYRPRQGARLAEFLWSVPLRSRRPARERAWLNGARPFEVPCGLGRLQAWSWGSGPCVLLVHGWDGRGSQLGAMAKPLVEAGFRVVTFDSRGHGDSFGRRACLASFADCISALARHTGPLHGVIAHSFGAAATLYAVRGGLQVERVVFLGPVNAVHGASRFAKFMEMSPECTRIFEQNVQRRLGDTYELLSEKREGTQGPPLLVYHDAEDLFVPTEDGQELAGLWGHARYIQTRGLGHHRVLRDAAVLGEVRDFLCSGQWPARGVDPSSCESAA